MQSLTRFLFAFLCFWLWCDFILKCIIVVFIKSCRHYSIENSILWLVQLFLYLSNYADHLESIVLIIVLLHSMLFSKGLKFLWVKFKDSMQLEKHKLFYFLYRATSTQVAYLFLTFHFILQEFYLQKQYFNIFHMRIPFYYVLFSFLTHVTWYFLQWKPVSLLYCGVSCFMRGNYNRYINGKADYTLFFILHWWDFIMQLFQYFFIFMVLCISVLRCCIDVCLILCG